jgi:hypothetical protein
MAIGYPFRRQLTRTMCWVALAVAGATGCALAATGREHESQVTTGLALRASEGPAATPGVLPDQELLLWEACRYLRLSRGQAGRLLPIARTVRRARQQFQREDTLIERRIARLGERRPDEAEQWAEERERRRTEFEAQMGQWAAPQVVQILTREQIALVWYLQEGKPPASAAAHPVLLNPAAGFLRGNRRVEALQVELDINSLRGQGRDALFPDIELAQERLTLRSLDGGLTFQRFQPQEVPFPQWVVETTNVQELVPVVELVARTLFESDRWVSVLQQVHRQGLDVLPSRNPGLGTRRYGRTLRHYQPARGFADLAGRGREVEPLGGVVQQGLYQFGPGAGLRLPDVGVEDDYQIEFSFRFAGGTGYQKLIDFKQGRADGGLYLYNGRLTFYTLANGVTLDPGREYRLRLERDGETRIVRAYIDFRPVFAFIDLHEDAVFENQDAYFFVDDVTTRNEHGPGALRWLVVRAVE